MDWSEGASKTQERNAPAPAATSAGGLLLLFRRRVLLPDGAILRRLVRHDAG